MHITVVIGIEEKNMEKESIIASKKHTKDRGVMEKNMVTATTKIKSSKKHMQVSLPMVKEKVEEK